MPDGLAAFLTEGLEEAERNAGEIHTRDCQAMSPMVIWGSPSQGCGPCNCGQPERELRAIAAKRAILAEHPVTGHGGHLMCDRCVNPYDPAGDKLHRWVRYPCPTVRQLATEWNDHPAYLPEWSPEPAQAP